MQTKLTMNPKDNPRLLSKEDLNWIVDNHDVENDEFWVDKSEEEFREYVYSRGYYDMKWFVEYHLEARSGILQDTKVKLDVPRFHEEIWEYCM